MKNKLKTTVSEDADILNRSLEDLPGEQWADIPWLDGLAKISNRGRVKRVPHEVPDSRGFSYMLKERIQKIKLETYHNSSLNEYHYHPTSRVCSHKKSHLITVSRAVYFCFVEQYDLEDRSLLIIARDHNGLNMKPDNLLMVTYEGFQDHIRKNNRRDTDFWKKNVQKIPFFSLGHKSHRKEISQYDKNGSLIATYESIAKAAKELNVRSGTISPVVNGKGFTGAGYLWQYGKEAEMKAEKVTELKSRSVRKHHHH